MGEYLSFAATDRDALPFLAIVDVANRVAQSCQPITHVMFDQNNSMEVQFR